MWPVAFLQDPWCLVGCLDLPLCTYFCNIIARHVDVLWTVSSILTFYFCDVFWKVQSFGNHLCDDLQALFLRYTLLIVLWCLVDWSVIATLYVNSFVNCSVICCLPTGQWHHWHFWTSFLSLYTLSCLADYPVMSCRLFYDFLWLFSYSIVDLPLTSRLFYNVLLDVL